MPQPFSISIDLKIDFPISAGLGSSAAYTSALACLYKMLTYESPKAIDGDALKEIYVFALKLESIYHSTPSGIDNFCSIYGGLLLKTEGKFIELKTNNKLKYAIIDTGTKHKTFEGIQRVMSVKQLKNDVYLDIMNRLGDVTNELADIIQEDHIDFERFKNLVDQNNEILSRLGVDFPEANRVAEICKKYDIVSKITGSGCGGCLICFYTLEKNFQSCFDELTLLGYTVEDVEFISRGMEVLKVLY